MNSDYIDKNVLSSDKLGIRLTILNNEPVEWIEKETCKTSTAMQLTDIWARSRIGCIQASQISECVGRSVYPGTDLNELAKTICGLTSKSFNKNTLDRLTIGISGEPFVRNWYFNEIEMECLTKGLTIPYMRELGVSVWNVDPRFRGSVDAEVGINGCAEFKIPKKMYRSLIEHIMALKRGHNVDPKNPTKHIANSNKDQMTQNCIIHNKKYCDYVVYSDNDKLMYTERVYTDYDHWNNVLYPLGVEYYEKYLTPLMKENKIYRLDP
jgi:hypothetical protein